MIMADQFLKGALTSLTGLVLCPRTGPNLAEPLRPKSSLRQLDLKKHVETREDVQLALRPRSVVTTAAVRAHSPAQ